MRKLLTTVKYGKFYKITKLVPSNDINIIKNQKRKKKENLGNVVPYKKLKRQNT